MKLLKKTLLLFLVMGATHCHVHGHIHGHAHEEPPCVIVIFGATGDLTSRKLLPALYNLALEGKLSKNVAIVGFSRRDYDDAKFRATMGDAIEQFSRTKPLDRALWEQFQRQIFYNPSSFEQDEGYEKLSQLLARLDKERGTQGHHIYYLATPPSEFPIIIEKLSKHHLLKTSKVMIEKPFGHDLDSAKALQKTLLKHLTSDQIYRIDHYLGKKGLQNLFTLRFENAFFEPVWNNRHIDNIQITHSETMGIGTRGRFWEETGFLRDSFQNHLMQILSVVAMEPPSSLTAEAIRKEKIKVLNAIQPLTPDQSIIRGQYGPGQIEGKPVVGYRQEPGVSPTSQVETYVAAKLFIDNARWKGVPFYVRGGKRLPVQTTEVVVTFKKTTPFSQEPNALFIRIQPDPGIFLKVPGIAADSANGMAPVDEVVGTSSPEAYEQLFYACIHDNHALFVSAEEQFAAWRLLTPVLKAWQSNPPPPFPNYNAGTWGPIGDPADAKSLNRSWNLLKR